MGSECLCCIQQACIPLFHPQSPLACDRTYYLVLSHTLLGFWSPGLDGTSGQLGLILYSPERMSTRHITLCG